MRIQIDDLTGPGIRALLEEHLAKSMRTPKALRGKGAGRAVLQHMIAEARSRGLRRLSLETGSQPGFEPARALYRSFGFTPCGPFGDYREDPNSVFMTLALQGP